MHDTPLVGGGVEIEIAAQVGPVIERLHDGGGTAAVFELLANVVQKCQRIFDAIPFFSNRAVRPVGQLRVGWILRQALEGAHDDMVRLRKRQ